MEITKKMQDQMRQMIIANIEEWQGRASLSEHFTLPIYVSVDDHWFDYSISRPERSDSRTYIRVYVEYNFLMGVLTTAEQVLNQIVDKFKWL